MSDTASANDRLKMQFRTVTFGGYDRSEVDSFLAEFTKAAKIDRDELDALRRTLEDLKAASEAADQGAQVRLSRLDLEIAELRSVNRAQRDELDRAKLDLARALETTETLREEKDSYQRLAERLSADEHQTKEMLRAASRASEEIRAEAKREAEEVQRRAEEQARHLEDDARKRVEELRKEYERVRRDYDDFLRQARDITDGLIRRIEDARAKWPG